MLQLARKYYGENFAGLTIDECDYTAFEHWYNNTHTSLATEEKYKVAQWIWSNYE